MGYMDEDEEHAKLSASTSDRWMNCPMSVKLSENIVKTESTYAKEGTEAHALAEIKLSFMLGKISPQEYDTRFDHFRMVSQYYNSEFNEFVNDYCIEVMDIITKDYEGVQVKVFLESRVPIGHITGEKDAKGTSDVVIVGPDFVHIIDLKFGKGVAVSAIDNSQLKLYALGAIAKHVHEGIFKEARMTIIQPRLYDRSTYTMSVVDLNKWAAYVTERGNLALSGSTEIVTGDHCRFCPVRGQCQALSDRQLAAAQAEFEDVIVKNNILEPQFMTDEMLARILEIAPKFIAWFKDVNIYAFKAALNEGRRIPGYKLVEGKANRIITNPDKVAEMLNVLGFENEKYLEQPKLKGITALEKNIGRKLFNDICKDYIIKPQGRPSLVPITDKRIELDSGYFKLNGNEFDNDQDEDFNE